MIAPVDGGVVGTGIGLGAASMLSIGPNNLLLIREGLARGRIVTVATLVWGSYVVLVVAAVCFADLSQSVGTTTRQALSWLGLGALTWFAVSALRIALSRQAHAPGTSLEPRRACLRRVLAIVWLNPLTYLELLIIPAAVCATESGPLQRSEFAGAVLTMAAVSCYGYALGGSLCGRLVKDARVIRAFDLLSGLLLAVAAIALALRLVG